MSSGSGSAATSPNRARRRRIAPGVESDGLGRSVRALDPRLLARASAGAATARCWTSRRRRRPHCSSCCRRSLLARIVAARVPRRAAGGVSTDVVLLALAFAARGALAWAFEVAGRRAAAVGALRASARRSSSAGSATSRARARRRRGGRDRRPRRSRASTASRPTSPGTCRRSCSPASFPSPSSCSWPPIDLESALIMLATLPLVPVFMWLIGRYTEERTRERWLALRLLSTHFLDVVRGLPTLRAFNRGRGAGGDDRRRRRALPARDDGDAPRRLPLGLRARAGGDAGRGARRGHGRRAARRRRPRPRRRG